MAPPTNFLAPKVIPREVVRDLLGIARILWASRKAEGAPDEELKALAEAGQAFATALSLAHCAAETIGGRAAWSWAETGLRLLGEALGSGDAMASEMVASWGGRLKQFPDR